jgi:DNA-binding GntR family transcriptional regulator
MSGHLKQVRLDSYKPLRELVSEHIREAIINGVFSPGERLMEIQMADEMGVSRTPVREALRMLEMEGFVVMIPRRGTYVSNMSIKDINDVYEIRISLDTLAAGLAAERITDAELEELQRLLVKVGNAIESNNMSKIVEADIEFHDVLYKASRNERLRNIINNLREQITVIRGVSMRYPGRLKDTQEEHRRLVESIAARNVEKSQEAARIHLENAERTLMTSMAERMETTDIESSFPEETEMEDHAIEVDESNGDAEQPKSP